MIDYNEWLERLLVEDIKHGYLKSRSNAELKELYEIYSGAESERVRMTAICAKHPRTRSEIKLKEADALVDKGMRVILSCNSLDQLRNAITFCNLIFRKVGRELGMVNKVNMHPLFERSVGYAQCKIKANAINHK
jgi:hypothetical protein